jgi:hypothetical protein
VVFGGSRMKQGFWKKFEEFENNACNAACRK